MRDVSHVKKCSRGYDHDNEEETQKFIIEMKKLQLQNRSLDVEFRKEETLVKDIDESITKMRENVGEDLNMIFNVMSCLLVFSLFIRRLGLLFDFKKGFQKPIFRSCT